MLKYFKLAWMGEEEEKQGMELKDEQTAQLHRLCYP